LGLPFVDLDDTIAARSGMPVDETLRTWGVPRFRAVEAALLGEFGQGPGCVVATGGGAPTTEEGRRAFSGFNTLWLDVSLEQAAQRVQGTDRPLWHDASVHQLFQSRRPAYAAIADRRVKADGDIEGVVIDCLEGGGDG
jgi:shikimate kinase